MLELMVMQRCVQELRRLAPAARRRALAWLNAAYGEEDTAPQSSVRADGIATLARDALSLIGEAPR